MKPKEYIFLKLRLVFNVRLYQNKIIPYDVYNRMQNLLIERMEKVNEF